MMLLFWLSANFLISRVIQIETTNEVCRGEYAISGMFLKGHTFKTIMLILQQVVTAYVSRMSDAKATILLLAKIFAS